MTNAYSTNAGADYEIKSASNVNRRGNFASRSNAFREGFQISGLVRTPHSAST
jgi:hypothetical protein